MDPRRKDAAAFWLSVIAVAASSMVMVVALARHLAPGELATVSAVLAVSFVCAVLPVAVQSLAAARRAGNGTSTELPWTSLKPVVIAALVLSPIVATAIGVPVLVVVLPVVQVVPALLVAVARGELIALERHRTLAVNHVIEAAVRVGAGIALGWFYGAVGVAVALVLAMVVALATLRYPQAEEHEDETVPATLAALAALTVAIHLDVLLAPRLLGPAEADTYAVAALPAKGVFLALMAAGWLIIPSAAGRSGWQAIRQPVLRTLAAGVVLSAGLVAALPIVVSVFAKGRPEPLLALTLGLAMAAAAATWVGVQLLLVKDSSRLTWPPILGLGAAALVLLTTLGAPASWGAGRLAVAVLAGQVAALVSTLTALLRVARATPFDRPRRIGPHWITTLPGMEPAGLALLASAPWPGPTIDLRGRQAVVRPTEPLSPPDGADAPQPLGDRTPRAWLSAGSLLLLVGCVLQQPGKIVHETKLDMALDPGRFLARTLDLWEPVADFGHVQNQAVGYLFPMGPFYLLGNALGLPVWLTQRLFMAALLVAAFWGMTRLADWMGLGTPAARVVGGMAYALSPYMIARIGNTSAMVTGAAFLPWILLLLVRASKLGSTRRAGALAGLAVLLTGGVNAAVTAAVLAVPLLWLLTRTPGARRRSLSRWFLASTALATLWWLLPLFFQQRFGFNFLPYTERAATTTAFTPLVEVLRGTADWLGYLNLNEPWVPSGWDLVSNPLTIIGTGLVTAMGLAGLARRDNPERTFLLLVFGAGVMAIGAGFVSVFANPAAPAMQTLLDGPLGMFRNVFKFTPLIAFATSMGVTHLLGTVVSWKVMREYAPRVLAAAGAVVLLGALPMLQGKTVSAHGFDAVPQYWREVAAYHDTNAGGSRSLLLPGTAFGDHTWGRTNDEVLQALTDTPWGVRSLIPLGSAGATRLLDSIDASLVRGGSEALPAALARAGVGQVIVRNDLAWRQWNAPRPAQVRRALDTSGLERAAVFGPTLAEMQSNGAPSANADAPAGPPTDALDQLVGAGERDLHAVEVYRVTGAAMVTAVPAASVPILTGGPEATLTLEEQGLAAGAAILSGDLPNDLPADVPLGVDWVQTDTLARRDTAFGLSRDNTGAVLAATQTGAGGAPVEQLSVYDERKDPGAAGRQAVAEWDGIAGVSASSYGSWLYGVPEASPAHLFDGDPTHAWVAGAAATSVGEWVRIDLGVPLPLAAIDLVPLADGPWRPRITRLRVATDSGERLVELPAPAGGVDAVSVPLPEGASSWIRLTIDAVDHESSASARAGIGEVRIDGIAPRQVIRLADDRPANLPGAGTVPEFVLRRNGSADPRSLLRGDEEGDIARRIMLHAASELSLRATALPVPGPALSALLHPSVDLQISASSTLRDLPDHDVHNLLDGDPSTAWIAQPLPTDRPAQLARAGGSPAAVGSGAVVVNASSPSTDANPSVTLRWGKQRSIDALRITAIDGMAQPDALNVVAADGTMRSAVVDRQGWARFAPIATEAITVQFPSISGLATADVAPLSTFGIADLEVPAIGDLVAPRINPDAPITIPCGEGPVASVDGVPTRFTATTTAARMARLLPIRMTSCATSPVAIAAGVHDVLGARGNAPLVLDTLVLSPATAGAGTSVPARTVTVAPGQWNADHRQVEIGGGAASVLVVAENFNTGWQATLDDRTLTPIRIDGWKQGFLVPGGSVATVELRYGPAVPYRLALGLGALLALLLAGAAALPDRGRRVPPLGVTARELSPRLAVVLVVVASVWAAGLAGLVALPLMLLVRRRALPWAGWLPSAFYAAAVALVAAFPGRLPADHAGAFSPLVQLLAGIGVTSLFVALIPLRTEVPPEPEDDEGMLVVRPKNPARSSDNGLTSASAPPRARAIAVAGGVADYPGCLPDDDLDPVPDHRTLAPVGGPDRPRFP